LPQFFVFLLCLVSFSAAVGALALGCASALSSAGKTILVMNLVLLLGVLFAGFLANKDSIPVWLRWLTWLSAFRWVLLGGLGRHGRVFWGLGLPGLGLMRPSRAKTSRVKLLETT
jgi:membrane protease YdiL (CAAX protease family)